MSREFCDSPLAVLHCCLRFALSFFSLSLRGTTLIFTSCFRFLLSPRSLPPLSSSTLSTSLQLSSHNMSKSLALLSSCCFIFTAMGQTVEQLTDSLRCERQLHAAVVQSQRREQTLSRAHIHTRLIGREQIVQSGATQLHELLQQELPGVELSHTFGGEQQLNMGGFSGQGLLFLVDDERLAGETMDNIDFARLNLSDIDRIEIVKGAATAIYGSGAAGGVVRIYTRRANQAPWMLRLDGQYGRYGKSRLGTVWSRESSRWGHRFSMERSGREGYALENPIDAALYTKYALQRVMGGRSWNFKEHFHYQPLSQLRLQGRASYFFRERDYDAGQRHRYRDFAGGLRGEWTFSPEQQLELSYAFDQYDKSDFYPLRRLDVRDYSNVQHSWRSRYKNAVSQNLSLLLGSDVLRDYLSSYHFSDGRARIQWNVSTFGQAVWQWSSHWEASAALRADHYSQEGGLQATSQWSLRYRRGGLVFRGSYGSGFRSASLKERFMHLLINDLFIIRGKENLQAEKSHNFHLSGEWTRRQTHLTMALGYHHVAHRISTSVPTTERDPASQLPYVDYLNLPQHRVLTAEGTAQQRWRVGGVRMSAQFNYAYTHETVARQGSLTPYLPARPHSATTRWEAQRKFSPHYDLHVLLQARWLSALNAQEYNATTGAIHQLRYPSYALVRLGTTHRIGKAVCLTLSADNLLNYRPHIYYYNSPPTQGIELSLGLTLDLHSL